MLLEHRALFDDWKVGSEKGDGGDRNWKEVVVIG